MEIKKIDDALKELRAGDKRKFIQTVDLIVNLQNFDARKEQVNAFIKIPNPVEKKICAFLNKKSNLVDTITEADFDNYKNPEEFKKFSNKYDFFIASAPLMGKIATKFGRILGPVGKMPSPQAGIIPVENDTNVKAMVGKMKSLIRIRTKEKSIKLPIGKEDMSDKELKENIESVASSIEHILPKKNDNIKNILIKFTMTNTVRIK